MSTTKLEKAIVIAPEPASLQVSIPDAAIQVKRTLLGAASVITVVSNDVEQERAVAVIAKMKAFTREVKKLGLDARRPFKDIQDAVIAKERELTSEVEAEIDRSESLVAAYQAEIRRKLELERQEAERKRQAAIEEERRKQEELARLERERIAAEQRAERERMAREAAARAEQEKLAELERQRKQAEIDAANAKSKAAQERAAAEQARIERERQEAEAKAAQARKEAAEAEAKALEEKNRLAQAQFEAEMAAMEASEEATAICTAPVVNVNNGVKGASVGDDWDIEVLDVHALYASHRQCVDLKPRLQAIKDLVRAGIRDIPGVRLTPKTKVAVRAAKQPSLIQ